MTRARSGGSRDRPLTGLRGGVFGKGGAGKSTVVVLLARALRGRGYSVLVLDADSTNVGLAAALGAATEPEPLLAYFGGTMRAGALLRPSVFAGGTVTCPVDDPTVLPGARMSLDALPPACVGRNGDGVYLLVAGKLGPLGPGAGCDGPVAKIARDLRVAGIGPDDVVLVDFKAGLEDSARGALPSIDWALDRGRPDGGGGADGDRPRPARRPGPGERAARDRPPRPAGPRRARHPPVPRVSRPRRAGGAQPRAEHAAGRVAGSLEEASREEVVVPATRRSS